MERHDGVDHFIVNSRPGYKGDSCEGVWREPHTGPSAVFANFQKIAVEEPSTRLPLEDAGSGKWAADFKAVKNMHSAPYPSFFHDGGGGGEMGSWSEESNYPWTLPPKPKGKANVHAGGRDLLVSYIAGFHGFPNAKKTRERLFGECNDHKDCHFVDAVGMRDKQSAEFQVHAS